MGILMLMKGDYESSKKYLKFAEQSGLMQLDITKELSCGEEG